jgi:hypothetical protein
VVQTVGGKAVPKKKYGLLICYREMCTRVVASVTYRADEEDLAAGVTVAVTDGDDISDTTANVIDGADIAATTAGVGVGGVGVVSPTSSVLWLLTRPPAADVAQRE